MSLAETVEAFAALVAEGTVGPLGVSNHWTWRVERARGLAAAAGLPVPARSGIRPPTPVSADGTAGAAAPGRASRTTGAAGPRLTGSAAETGRAGPRGGAAESRRWSGRAGPQSGRPAQLSLLAAPARLAWPGGAAGGGRAGAARVAEFAEDFAEPVVHLFEDGGPVVEVDLVEVGKPSDGLVDARIAGGGESHPGPF